MTRETQQQTSLQQWRGIDQRTQPTLLRDGFFSSSRGLFFGLDGAAERISGKALAFRFVDAILNEVEEVYSIFQFGDIALVQTISQTQEAAKLYFVSIAELYALTIPPQPGVPAAPVISGLTANQLIVTTPAFPTNTGFFVLQVSVNDSIWSTVNGSIGAGIATLQNGFASGTTRYYRVGAHNPNIVGIPPLTTWGPSVSVTTLIETPIETESNLILETEDSQQLSIE